MQFPHSALREDVGVVLRARVSLCTGVVVVSFHAREEVWTHI